MTLASPTVRHSAVAIGWSPYKFTKPLAKPYCFNPAIQIKIPESRTQAKDELSTGQRSRDIGVCELPSRTFVHLGETLVKDDMAVYQQRNITDLCSWGGTGLKHAGQYIDLEPGKHTLAIRNTTGES